MRAALCFSHFQLSRCQIHTFAGSWWKKVHNFSRKGENSSKFQSLGPNICSLHGGHSKRLNNIEGKNIISRRVNNIGQQMANLTQSSLNSSRVEISECKSVHIEQKIVENEDITKPITIIVFDTETSGLKRKDDRIIEIALQDLSGGENSTFQTLVNPDKIVTNSNIHGISEDMVDLPEVPRMEALIPILVQYVKSRQKPGGQVLFISHNCKSFDFPFLINEFRRCFYEIPSDWHFLDAMSLARAVKKAEGSELSSISLQSLREYYKIPLIGEAHRAMADVNVLAQVLQKMTHDLKLTVSGLLKSYAFTETIDNSKKKKNSR
ncbi:hypothetical protein L1987_60611 [Smallanthus sonchifolius]|uniref:Uncharacterized protein n=1 Tax=Smallanthus sonchifolius TaxID=185202 RepID=A0ACB9D8K5_9ASTR|nr:hypothetical protein L1987_60611 [Smallanthus sonchifolius]